MRIEQKIERAKKFAEKYRTSDNYILNDETSNEFDDVAKFIEEIDKMLNDRMELYGNQMEKAKDEKERFAIVCVYDELALLLGKMNFGQSFKFLEPRTNLLGDEQNG